MLPLLIAIPLGATSCSGDPFEMEMHDGFVIDDAGRIETLDATQVVLEHGDVTLGITIPDRAVGSLPFGYAFRDQPCKYATDISMERSTASGRLEFLESIPEGFSVRYEIACGKQILQGTRRLVSIGTRRKAPWPYCSVRPGESFREKLLQLAKDAWNGAVDVRRPGGTTTVID